ncbi:tyrosine-type recombinase/integrase [Bradyrhizobium sp. HKCCYLS2038]|uniref:tyrosine-type recombinase/integrase n=1 Tax=unclassified Bradyrhizobium TaxID=2631580 RepID=UPI003EBFF26C
MANPTLRDIAKAEKEAKADGKPRRLGAGNGLFLEVSPAGGKSWKYKFRLYKGDGDDRRAIQKELTIGNYDLTTEDEAREKHNAARKLVRDNEDPAAAKQAEKATKQQAEATSKAPILTFQSVAAEWLAMRDKIGRAGKTADRAERMVRYLTKAFGSTEITKVEVSHLAEVLKKAEAEGKYETRVRLQGHAIKIMGFAVARGYITASPFAAIRDVSEEGWISPSETHERRKAVTDEPDGAAKFGELMRAIDGYEGRNDNLIGAALKLLALTFVRPGDVRNARWEQFDLDNAKWSVPFDTGKQRTQRKKANFRVGKPHDVPLSRQAVELLRELKEFTGDQLLLFPGRQNGRPLSDGGMNAALKVLGYGDRHDPHGFRSSASTILNEERTEDGAVRFDPALIEMQLDHVDDSVRALYARGTYWPDRVRLMQYWADKVDTLRNPPKPKPDLSVVAA